MANTQPMKGCGETTSTWKPSIIDEYCVACVALLLGRRWAMKLTSKLKNRWIYFFRKVYLLTEARACILK